MDSERATGKNAPHLQSLDEIHSTVEVRHPSFWRRLFAFVGPAYIVSVGYMDPGNWATDIEGGSRFGYQLIWVLLHRLLADILLGQTVDSVRHSLDIPIVVVRSSR